MDFETELNDLIREDSVLPAHIKSNGDVVEASEIKTILLTGLTGHIGPYLLKSLLDKETVKVVYCLVREKSLKFAEELLKLQNADRVVILKGDLSQEHFCLDTETYDKLLENVDAVIHMAVKSHHLEMYKKNEGSLSDIRTINVLGTLKILEFACTGKPKRIIYGSTAGACNRLSDNGTILSEELIEENNFGDGLTNGYLVSKFVSEKLLTEAIRRGIHCIILRYSIIVGETDSGGWTLNSKIRNERSHIFLLMASYLQTRMKPVFMSAFSAHPVDICAAVTLQLMFNDKVPCGFFNLTNPHGQENDDFCKVAEKLGFILTEVDMKTFSKTLREYEKDNNDNKTKIMLAPLKKVYFSENAEEIISKQALYTKLACQKNAGDILNKVSEKFKQFVPNYEQQVDTPNEIMYKFLLSINIKSYV